MENLYLKLKAAIEKAQSIIIFSHVNPDGDTLGSNLALSFMIEKYFNKQAESVFAGTLPSIYCYLPGYERFKGLEAIDKNKKYDLAIAVDIASKDRMITGAEIYDNALVKVNIDHHKTNIGYGDINIIDGDAACTGIVLNRIFDSCGYKETLDAARCLYTSLLTDTGGFRFNSTNAECFLLAARLVDAGVSPMQEYRACYETKPQTMVQFQAYVISNAVFYNEGAIAFAKVTRSDMSRFGASDEYTEGIVEVLRSSKNVEIAAILKETKEGWTKVSLRSKTIDIIPAVLDFGGGGHTFAAGCTIKKPLPIAFDKLLKRVQLELEK